MILPCQCLVPAPGVRLLGTRHGLVRLHDAAVAAAINELTRRGWGTVLASDDVRALLSACGVDDTLAATDFLREAGVLRIALDGARRFERIRLIQWPSAQPGALNACAEELSFFTGLPVTVECEEALAGDEFAILHLLHYDASVIRSIQDQARAATTAAVLTSYFVGRSLVIDAPFIPEAATPCHFCQYTAAASRPHGLGEPVPHWLQALADMQLPPGAFAGLEHPLRPSDHLLATLLLRNRVRELLGPHGHPMHPRTYLHAVQVRLDDLATVRDTPVIASDCDHCA